MFVERLVRSRRRAFIRVKSPSLREWGNVLRPFRRAFGSPIRLGLCAFLISAGLIVYDGLTDDLGHADVALVLGNKVNPDGKPSAILQARLDRALEVFRAGLVPMIIVSGGTGKEGFDEAWVMAGYLISHGVPAEQIIVDSEGVNTQASARNAARILKERGGRRVIVVSQYFHISRAKLALRRVGVQEVYSAHAYLFDLRDLYSVPREVVGFISYYCQKPDPAAK